MKKIRWTLAMLNLILLLAFVNYSAMQKERIVKAGKLIFLELVANDIKSPIVQGDVINLKYKIVKGLLIDTLYKRGYIVVKLDSNAIAERVRFQSNIMPKSADEKLIEYTKSYFSVNIGAEKFYIQQAGAKKYEQAKYGALRVDDSGNSLLVGLYDEHLKKIE